MPHKSHDDTTNGDPKSFDLCCSEALDSLQAKMNFGLWMVTRADGDDWIVLSAKDSTYGVQNGDVFVWMESFCSRMVKGLGPTFAPESDKVLAYAQAEIGKKIPIQAYMGFPLVKEDGELIGTLCAIDPKPVPENWANHKEFVEEIAAELAESYNREFGETLDRVKKEFFATTNAESVAVESAQDWTASFEYHEQRAKLNGEGVSIVIAKFSQFVHHEGDVRQKLHRIVGRANLVTSHGDGVYSAILFNCNAPKLDAYVHLIKNQFAEEGIQCELEYAVQTPSLGIRQAYRHALAKFDSAKSPASAA